MGGQWYAERYAECLECPAGSAYRDLRRPAQNAECVSPLETGRLHSRELPDASSRGQSRIKRRRRFPFGLSAISHLTNPHSAANRT